MPARRISLDTIRLKLAWVTETPDPTNAASAISGAARKLVTSQELLQPSSDLISSFRWARGVLDSERLLWRKGVSPTHALDRLMQLYVVVPKSRAFVLKSAFLRPQLARLSTAAT